MIGTYRLRNMQSIADSWENEGYQYFYFPTQLFNYCHPMLINYWTKTHYPVITKTGVLPCLHRSLRLPNSRFF